MTLALDTATPYLTLALAWEGGLIEQSTEVGRAHAEQLPEAVRGLFQQAGLPFWASLIVIGTGPGSYTGVRVGASYALGLGRVWQAEVVGVCTLESLVRGDGLQAVSLDARKGNIYSAVYEVRDGIVRHTPQPPAKRELSTFELELAAGPNILPHRQNQAPDGRALLLAGQAHGERQWQLAYL